jgi:hypothetical protein
VTGEDKAHDGWRHSTTDALQTLAVDRDGRRGRGHARRLCLPRWRRFVPARTEPWRPRPPDGATVAATDETFVERRPYDALARQAVAFEFHDRIAVHTDYRRINGTNQYEADSGWRLAGFTVEQDYRPVGRDPQSALQRDSSHKLSGNAGDTAVGMDANWGDLDSGVSRWCVRYDDNASTWDQAFATEFSPADPPSEGDTVSTNRLDVRARHFPFRRESFALETTPVYRGGPT